MIELSLIATFDAKFKAFRCLFSKYDFIFKTNLESLMILNHEKPSGLLLIIS